MISVSHKSGYQGDIYIVAKSAARAETAGMVKEDAPEAAGAVAGTGVAVKLLKTFFKASVFVKLLGKNFFTSVLLIKGSI
jgi:hypothetical protein